MQLRHSILAAALAAGLGSAHALPALSLNLGADPNNALVAGFAIGGSATTTYNFSLSTASDLSGALLGVGPITMSSIVLSGGSLLSPSSYALPDSGSFLFTGLGLGSYSLAFSYNTSLVGGFVGTVSATPVPEPQSLALALAGIGVVGFLLRRRMG